MAGMGGKLPPLLSSNPRGHNDAASGSQLPTHANTGDNLMSIFKVRLFVKSTLLLSSCIASISMAQQQTIRNLNDITLTACGSLACLQDQAEAFPVGGVGREPLATGV